MPGTAMQVPPDPAATLLDCITLITTEHFQIWQNYTVDGRKYSYTGNIACEDDIVAITKIL